MVNFGPITNPQDFIFGGSQGPLADCDLTTCTPANRHVARLAERAASATPQQSQANKPSNLRKPFKHVNSAEKTWQEREWHYEWLLIYLDAKVPRRCDSVKFPSFFFVFFVRQLQEETPALKRPKLETEAYGGCGGWMLSVDISSNRWIFRKAWSSDPNWYSNPPKLIFCDQSHIRESLRIRTEHWNQKPELNISIKATQT